MDGLLPGIVAALRAAPNLVLEAPPGAGKTTRVPPALLDAGLSEILVLEPRRLAARLAARFVAQERGENLGRTVGYQVRFEQVESSETRIRFVTEGVLTRRLLSDPRLHGVAAVILDEFHERHLEGDLALALLLRLQQTARPDLRLMVMSATLEGDRVARFLGGCPVLRSDGRLFPTKITYTPHSSEPLEQRVASALGRLVSEQSAGDVLVFLPGAAEIRRAMAAAEGLSQRHSLLLLPLHGDLSPERQDRAVAAADRRKVIFSTNVAESSITIEGVRAVIDSGLARTARDSPWTGLPRIEISPVSRASATQRAGRAARLGPGHVVRLFTEQDFAARPAHDGPEILRRELAGLCLDLHACGVTDPRQLNWLDAPPDEALAAAEELLLRLGALDGAGTITEDGRRMARMPVHPRLARLVLDAGSEGPALAALLSAGARLPHDHRPHSPSDLFVLLEQPRDRFISRLESQLRSHAARAARTDDSTVLKAVLCAFPDRVARRRKGPELRLSNGASALQAPSSAVDQHEFLVAIDIEERPDQRLPLVRIASSIQPDWLLDLFPERLREEGGLEWNRLAERVETRSALYYDQLLVDESRGHQPEPEAAAALLAQKALEVGLERFTGADDLAALRARMAFAAQHSSLPALSGDQLQEALTRACYGLRSFAELEKAQILERLLDPETARRLEAVAPSRVRLPGGRTTRVHYSEGQPPWIASRLQDFIGMTETPRIASGRVALVVHLLAPNQRPVQMTQDLAGFWKRLYPELRRQLSRRYPKHAWPELD